MSKPAKQVYQFGPFHLDGAERLLLRDGVPVPLTSKVFDTLLALIENNGHLVGKNELMSRLWPDTFVEEATLARNISDLRKALGDGSNGEKYIETVPKSGYRFTASVTRLWDEGVELVLERHTRSRIVAEEGKEAAVNDEPLASGSASSATRLTRRIVHHKLAIAALVFVIVALAGSAIYLFTRDDKTIDSVAVMPFANESGNPDMEYLADGLSESTISDLSQLPSLKVMSRNSVFRYKGQQIDPQAVGNKLGVKAVLAGRIMLRNDDLVISLELVDARDNRQIWGKQYTRKLSDILQLQADISRDVSAKLRLKLNGDERTLLTRHYTENNEAYELYLQGRFYLNQLTEAGFRKAVDYFNQAILKDRKYALAYAGLSDAYRGIGPYGAPSNERRLKAKEYALTALELDGDLAEARLSMAAIKYLYEWDWPGVEKEVRRALDLNPNLAQAHHQYGDYLATMGRMDEAISEFHRALELDPLSHPINCELGLIYYYAHQYDQAIAHARKTSEMDPQCVFEYLWIGRCLAQKDMSEEAIVELNKAINIPGARPLVALEQGYAYAVSGNKAAARTILSYFKERVESEHIDPTYIAYVYAGLGEDAQALAWLERGCDDRSSEIPGLKIEPKLERLRSNPRFQDLLRRVHLAQ
jgi:TolB-like protein/DNA-binding winged helix-turn-helix (wHTH) protein/Tfp pilus assembly protein PilF